MKVFLSSTGRDLKEYREAAFNAIQRLGHHCVRMEDFHGPAEKIEHFDEKKVAECDLFVILLGHLHGTCPDCGEKSYTELEYETAVELDKPRFLFLAPEEFPIPASLIEADAKRASQRAFRERVKGVIRHTFTSPEDLATQIALTLPRESNKSLLPVPPQPYFAHPYPLRGNFTGRLSERRMLTEWLTKGRNVLSIAAIGGMGKSALTWFWLQNDVKSEGVFWWSFYEQEASFTAFVREALRYASSGKADLKAALYDQLRELTACMAQERLLFVLDGFERELRAYAGLNSAYQGDDFQANADVRSCIDPRAGTFLQSIASSPMKSRVLLTTRLHPKELDGLAGCRQEDLNALDPEDAVDFFHAQGVKGTRLEIQAACQPYGFHPLALRLLAGVIVKDRRIPGDISVAARYPVSEELKGKAGHHILQVAYDAMKHTKRDLLSRLAAFRGPMRHVAIASISPYGSETNLDAALDELIDRGLLLFDRSQARYDLHPVIRQYAYDRLIDKPGLHTSLRDYFAKMPPTDVDKIESVDDLTPVIELYHHTVRAGHYDAAMDLFIRRLHNQLYYRFGEYRVCIELLRGLFANGEDQPPQLKAAGDQSWAQTALANAYSLGGQSGRAVPLFLLSDVIDERAGYQRGQAVGLANVAHDQLGLGQLREADDALRRGIDLSRAINDEFREARSHQDLGQLEAYQGRPGESVSELDAALSSFHKQGEQQSEGVSWAYRAHWALLMNNTKEAIESARRSRELADARRFERDIIRAEWLLGWALIEQSPTEAASHLSEALTRCRRINLVEFEPNILLAWARWHRAAGNAAQARHHANEALAIAGRCEYRLAQADVHNFLAQLALDSGDRTTARHHAEIARERAWCDGPPHCYKPALDEAGALLAKILE